MRSTAPVINNILLEIKPGELIFSSTNYEIFIKTSLKLKNDTTGKVLLPPKIIDIVRHLPAGAVEIDINTESYGLSIHSGPARFHLYGSAGEDYPIDAFLAQGEAPAEFNIELGQLNNIIREVIFAASTEETRPAFNGILFSFTGNKLTLTSSDTYRLVVSCLVNDAWQFQDNKCLVPAKALRELLKILGDGQQTALISYKDTYFSISYGNTFFASRLLGEKYPDVSGVIPESFKTRVELDKNSLESAVARASLLTQGKNQAVNILAGPEQVEVKVSAEDGSMEEPLSAHFEGEEVDLFLNSRFVLDILKIINEEKIIIDFHGDRGPVIFRLAGNEDFLCLVLPIKKSN